MNQPTEPVTQQGGRLASRRRSGGARRDALLFVLPLAVLLLVFVYAPMARLGYYAFTEYNGLRPPEWVGLDNFRFLIDWPDFQRAISNTLVLASGLLVWVTLPFLLSVVIFGRRGANLVRAILFLPALLPALIVGRAFRLVLAENGPINAAFHGIGLDALAQPWLSSETWVLPSLIAVIAWATMGTGVLLYSAGLVVPVAGLRGGGDRGRRSLASAGVVHLPPGARAGDALLGAAPDDRHRHLVLPVGAGPDAGRTRTSRAPRSTTRSIAPESRPAAWAWPRPSPSSECSSSRSCSPASWCCGGCAATTSGRSP